MRKGAHVTNRNGSHVKARRIKTSFVAIVVIFLLTLMGFSYLLNDVVNLSHKTSHLSKATAHLSLENSKRITEIQSSRVSSCKKTYRGVRDVFRPFFPSKPRTEAQKDLVQRFNRRINLLVRGCNNQTKPHQ